MGASGSNLVENKNSSLVENKHLGESRKRKCGNDKIWEAFEARVKKIMQANQDKPLDGLAKRYTQVFDDLEKARRKPFTLPFGPMDLEDIEKKIPVSRKHFVKQRRYNSTCL